MHQGGYMHQGDYMIHSNTPYEVIVQPHEVIV